MPQPGADAHILLWANGVLDLELALLGAGLLVLLFIGFWFVIRVRRWQKEDETERVTPQQQIETYRALMEEGLLDPQEFEKLRQRLTGQVSTEKNEGKLTSDN